jgi:hypothetical protein
MTVKRLLAMGGVTAGVPKLCPKFVRNIEKYANISENI